MNYNKLLLLIVFLSFKCFAGEEKFGVASYQNGVFCASFGEKPLPIGSSISILEAQSPQYFFRGKVGEESKNCEALKKAGVGGPYLVITTTNKMADAFIGIAVFSKNAVSVVNNEVVLNTISKEKIHFRSCTSSEGLHFSSWLGQPLKGEQLWQLYYYVGFDLEPSCQENDFNNLNTK